MQNNRKKTLADIVKGVIIGFFALCFAAVGVCCAAGAIYVSTNFVGEPPILLSSPDTAEANITSMMDAVCEGDYQLASKYMLGNPNIGADRELEDAVGALIWDAFCDSMEYELVGVCYATDAGLAQNVRFTCLDAKSVTAKLGERSQALLEERVENAEDMNDVYDENNEYRQDVVSQVLYDAAAAAIEEDAQSKTVEFVVNLRYQDGQWWIVADTALMDALFGDILF